MFSARTRARTTLVAAIACLAAALPGCSRSEDNDDTPSACLTSSADYRAALEAAPGEVELPDGTPISDCLPSEQTAGDLTQTGQLMVETATELNAGAARDPTGPEAVRLGFLVGAIERGSEGIHTDLVRRVNAAARFSSEGLLPPEFERTFGEGYAAGLESG